MTTRHRLLSIAIVLTALALCARPVVAGPPVPDCCSPNYATAAMDSYRRLQVKMSVYENPAAPGSGIRLGVYQAQADYGPGASSKNMDRLETAARTAKKRGVQIRLPQRPAPGPVRPPHGADGRVHRWGVDLPHVQGRQGTGARVTAPLSG